MKPMLAAALLLTGPAAYGQTPMPPAFAALAAKVLPSVVSVASTEPVSDSQNDDDSPDDAPSKADSVSATVIPPPKAQEALGAGFVIDPAGYILTNNHVIDGASSVTVTFQDGTILAARVVGADKPGDLAVLKVDAGHPLPAVTFGDSSALRVGDWVLAIGNPYALSGSASAGIVSALHRDIGADPYDDYIQTDAAINHGNSGGPLFDVSGHVIGVDSAIYSASGGSVGIGFAIPAAMAEPVAQALIAKGAMTRGWLGISSEDVTPAMQRLLALPDTKGALIGGVSPAGPAAKSLRPGDVLVALDDVPITNPRSLLIRTAEIPAGEAATAKFYRAGSLQTASITLQSPAPDQPPGSVPANTVSLALPEIGLAIARDAPAKVVGITPKGPASKAGIAVDDVIESLGAQAITSGADLKSKLSTLPATLLISGDDATGTDPGPRWVVLAK